MSEEVCPHCKGKSGWITGPNAENCRWCDGTGKLLKGPPGTVAALLPEIEEIAAGKADFDAERARVRARIDAGARRTSDEIVAPERSEDDKCEDCIGFGWTRGQQWHPFDKMRCETCKGTGKRQQSPQAPDGAKLTHKLHADGSGEVLCDADEPATHTGTGDRVTCPTCRALMEPDAGAKLAALRKLIAEIVTKCESRQRAGYHGWAEIIADLRRLLED